MRTTLLKAADASVDNPMSEKMQNSRMFNEPFALEDHVKIFEVHGCVADRCKSPSHCTDRTVLVAR